MFDARFRTMRLATCFAACSLLALTTFSSFTSAQVIVGSPFVTGFEGWQDTYTTPPPQAGAPPAWGVLLTPDPFSGQRFLFEASDGRAGDGVTTAGVADGKFTPYLMINTADITPANYTLTYQLATVDDDGFGVVFGYLDNDNYFRASFRRQGTAPGTGGNLGFQDGTSIQKVVNGVTTQIASTRTGFVPTTDGVPFEAKVVVTGSNWDVQVNNVSILNGSDADLQPGHYGVHSWGQREASTSASPQYGTIVGPISVASTTLNKTTDFANAVSSVPWRRLTMVNAFGETGFESPGGANVADDYGNFSQDFTNGTIRDDSNGNVNATPSAPNVDFMGPSIVVDTPAAAAAGDYRFTVRVENRDNDGIGVLFRVADDGNFYRANWATEGPGTGTTRPPLGLSIQKYSNFAWTEVYRDDQLNPLFLPQDSVPFDLSIQAVGNQFKIDVINDPDGAPQTISYGVITDNSGAILNGSVGFTNWGNGDGGNGAVYSAYNGDAVSLVSAISSFLDFGLTVNRSTGNVMLVNNSSGSANIKGVSILSPNGANIPGSWLSITDNYDEAPQNGSVDPDDPWTELSNTPFDLSERENSGGNGGTLTGFETVNLGNIWTKSQIEDLVVKIELLDGNFVFGTVNYINGPGGQSFNRSDLNTDGSVNSTDWGIFYPNMLTDMTAMSGVQRALAGDLDLDGDSDVNDFALFKADYEFFNGAGSFDAMVSVPEPSAVMLLLVGCILACGSRLRRFGNRIALVLGMVALFAVSNSAQAVPLDFTTFGTANYPRADSDTINTTDFFPLAVWNVTPTTASLNSNSDYTVLYSPTSAFNKKFTGTLTPGTDDDIIGFVLGFNPGDEAIGSSADYLVVDWKRVSQNFDVFDFAGAGPVFHDLTPGGTMPLGLALSRVTGSPNGDELWQHIDSPLNPSGGVTELARGATLGSTGWNTAASYVFELQYTPNLMTVKVDGVEQFSAAGDFTDGRFGLYSFAQGPTSTFSDFDVSDSDLVGMIAEVDRSDGTITLKNSFAGAVSFDFYQFSSPSNSLDSDIWNSLSEQNFQPAGAGAHQKWQQAGGSDSGTIAEVFLAGNSTLAGNGGSVGIGAAYKYQSVSEDLVFQYRLATGEIREGFVQYIGVAPPQGVPGDYNDDGVVNAADYAVWRDHLGQANANLPNDATGATVDASDYQVWQAHFGEMESGSGGGTNANVPEPSSLVLLAGIALWFSARRFGRRCA